RRNGGSSKRTERGTSAGPAGSGDRARWGAKPGSATAKLGAASAGAGCGLGRNVGANIVALLVLPLPLPRHLLEHLDGAGDAQHRLAQALALVVELGEQALAGGELGAQLGQAGFDLFSHRAPQG